MNDEGPSRNFMIGNALMAVALIMLLYIGALWESMGPAAMGLWIAVAGAGTFFLMKDKSTPKSGD